MNRTRAGVLVLLLSAGGGVAYYLGHARPGALVLTGIVTTNDVIVSPQIAGQITQLLVKEGDTVTRDQQRAAVALARSNAEQVAVRESQLQTNQQQLAAAAAQRTKADVRLTYTEIHAPIDGMVDVRAARPGEVVNPGQPILTLINPDDLWVRADIEESYIGGVKLGDKLTVRLP